MVGTIFSISPAFWTGCHRALELRRVFGVLLGPPQIIRVGWCSVFLRSEQKAVHIFSAIPKHSCPWADRLIPWGGVLQSIIQVRTYDHFQTLKLPRALVQTRPGKYWMPRVSTRRGLHRNIRVPIANWPICPCPPWSPVPSVWGRKTWISSPKSIQAGEILHRHTWRSGTKIFGKYQTKSFPWQSVIVPGLTSRWLMCIGLKDFNIVASWSPLIPVLLKPIRSAYCWASQSVETWRELIQYGWVGQNIYNNIPVLWNARAITSKARSTSTEKSRDQCLGCAIVKSGRDSGRAEEWWRRTAGNLAFIYAATITVSSSMASLGELDMVMSWTAFCFCSFVVELTSSINKQYTHNGVVT